MFRQGHYGAALLVYAPFGTWLASEGHTLLAVIGGAVMISFAMLPDVDHSIPIVPHRGPTHSLLFAAGVGAAGAVVGDALDGYSNLLSFDMVLVLLGTVEIQGLALFGGFVGALAVLAHLLADVLTPAGVPLFWPLSRHTTSLGLVRADNTIANYLLLGLGAAAVVTAVTTSVTSI